MIFLSELMDYELCKDWQSYRGFTIPNPENCKTYFQCQANGKGGYEAILRDCGAGTGFDPNLGNCNFLSSLPRCLRGMSQCPRTDLSKRFLPKPMTTTG